MHFHREKDCAKLIKDQHQIKPALRETIFPSVEWVEQTTFFSLKGFCAKKEAKKYSSTT